MIVFKGNIYPEPILIPVNEFEFKRYSKRSYISTIEAAFLNSGYLPESEDPKIFNNPYFNDIYRLYQDLEDAAQSVKIEGLLKKDGVYKASLLNWCRYLHREDFIIPNMIWDIYDYKILAKKSPLQLQNLEQQLNSKRDLLEKEILNICWKFPNIPRAYYRLHPAIQNLEPFNLGDHSFEDLVSEISKRQSLKPRKLGRPKKNFLAEYETAYPELNGWFISIRHALTKQKCNS
ncbi:MAG: hypothetical protein KDK62_05400 [Chlamydiia bacterium]|nr:hypothetical protein [Chlamydiia bacterium]